MRAFQGAFYLAALDGTYRLKEDKLTLFRETCEEMRTAYALSVGPSGLWSVGTSDIAVFDGSNWHMIRQA